MSFRIHALPANDFQYLSTLSEAELFARLIRRMVADKRPGFPCRVSLEDARPGETVFLLNYVHQPADSPFRASHATYVREGVPTAAPAPGEVPDMIRNRLISLRAFDDEGMLTAADVADGADVPAAIETMFANPDVACIHLHFAKQGCYAARVDRV